MKNKLVHLIIFLCVSFLLITCKKSNNCKWAPEPPMPVLFQIKKSGQLLTDSTFLSSIKLSYYQNNNKYYVTNFGLLVGTNNNTYYKKGLMSANIGLVNNSSKTYYLEYPNNANAQDTLFADYLTPSSSTNCQYKINKVLFNKQSPTSNTIDFSFSVYVFDN